MSKARIFSAEYKAQIVMELLREENTLSEVGAKTDISAKQLCNWKHEFIKNAYRAFSVTKDEKAANMVARAAQEREQELMAKIGQLTYECDWLKKKYEGHISDRKKGYARQQ